MRLSFFFLVVCILNSCSNPIPDQTVLGAWKVDSTYSYYNGFGYSETEGGSDWAILAYDATGKVKEIKFGTYRQHFYEFIREDSLIFKDEKGQVSSAFKVLELDQNVMTLFKEKSPIFAGSNQRRYEIRYFSRTALPQNIDQYMPGEVDQLNEE